MYRKIMILVLASAIFAWAPATTALAATNSAAKPDLHAKGHGYFHLKSKGKAVIKNDGVGAILIRNVKTTDIKMKGKAKITPLPKHNAILFEKLKGALYLKGKEINATIKSPKQIINAYGKGMFLVKGKGLFKIKGKPVMKWPTKKVKKFTF